jgi:hypothetical protein
VKVSNQLLKDATATGKSLIAATDAAAARTALGLATVAASGSYNDLSDKPTSSGVTFAKTKVVGVDAQTIQGCIDLVTDATGLNQTQILIPPGVYAENLTLKPCVSLASTGGNNGQGAVVRINGYHTCQGSATAGDSILELNGLRLDTNTANPVLTLTANGSTKFLVHMQDCMVSNSNSSTSVVGVQINANVTVRAANVRSIANSTAGAGGTHYDVNGGSLYLERCSGEFGTSAILMRGTNGALTPYAEVKWSNYVINGANAISITSTTALLTMGWSAFQNLATTGNGISIAAGSVAGVFDSTFTVTAGASNYVVTGDLGSAYYAAGNNYSNAPYATFETKINPLVAQFNYSTSRDAQVDVYNRTAYPSGSATWVKPSGAKSVQITLISGGGGGGSGQKGPTGSNRGSGGGGAGGGHVTMTVRAEDLPSSVTVLIGAGGAGGAARTTDGNGTTGTRGGSSKFGDLTCFGGGAGAGGATAGAGGGTTAQSGNSGGAGSPTTTGTTGVPSSNTVATAPGGAGGGGGGGLAAAATGTTGGANGGRMQHLDQLGGGGGPTGADGFAGNDSTVYLFGGAGGGGGGGRVTGNAGAGGAGGFPGGGGGGGGAAEAGNSGAGGAGGAGLVVVTTYF